MRNFNRGNNRFSGGRDFNRRDFGRRDSSDRFTMHQTTCSKCGNECEVPFRPTGEKPVFCNKCFESVRRSDSRRFEGRNTGGSSEGQYKKQFESLNWKLDKILKILTPAASPEVVREEKKGKETENLKPKKSTNSVKKKKPVVEKETSV